MPAYVINDLEVTDPVIFDEYRKRSPPTLAQFGGRFVVRGGAVGSLEGDWLRKRLVVLGSMSSTAHRAGGWTCPARWARFITSGTRPGCARPSMTATSPSHAASGAAPADALWVPRV